MLQIFWPLVMWTFFSAYFGYYIYIAISVVMAVQYVVLETFIFGWLDKEKIFDAVLCEEPANTRLSRVQQIFFTNICITSCFLQITFCNKSDSVSFVKQHKKLPITSKYFYEISSATTNICLLIMFAFLCGLNYLDINPLTNKTSSVIHCVHHSSNVKFSGFKFLVNGTNYEERLNLFMFINGTSDLLKNRYERICSPTENHFDYFFRIVPFFVIPFVMNIVGTCLTCARATTKIMPSCFWKRNNDIIMGAITRQFYEAIENSKQLKQIQFPKLKRLQLNNPDLSGGDTLLHVAFQKGMFGLCKQMILQGGNPFQKNNNGESIISLIQNQERLSFKQTKQTWLSETYFENMIFEEDKNCLKGIAFISDGEERIRWSMEMKDSDDIVIANSMLKEASIMIERSDNIVGDQILAKELNDLKVYATTLKPQFQDLKNFILFDLHEEMSLPAKTFWKIPPLHRAIKNHGFILFDILCFFGAFSKAENKDSEQPLQMAMNQLSKDIVDKAEIDYNFLWKVLVRGGAKYIRNVEEPSSKNEIVQFILKNFPCKDSYQKLPANYAELLFLHAVHLNNYQEYKSFKMNVKYFLDLGCSLTASSSNNKMTVLHLAAQHQTAECLTQLLVKLVFTYHYYIYFLLFKQIL